MKKLLAVLLTAAIAATMLATGCAENSANPAAPNDGTTVGGYDTSRVTYDTSPTDEPLDVTTAAFEPPTPPEVPDIAGVTWLVEPRYGAIWYCEICDTFADSFADRDGLAIIDERTAMPTGNFHPTDSCELPDWVFWVYDEERDLLGWKGGGEIVMYPRSEFAIRFPDYVGQIITVIRLVDSSLREFIEDHQYPGYHFIPEAWSHETAVIYNGEFVIEFDYWSGNVLFRGRIMPNITPFQYRKVGVVNHLGEVLVPFVFPDILIINESTAFASLPDGFWGIITWES
jgi:hypothetical protein